MVSTDFNSNDIADNLKRGGAFIPGIRPGEQTASFIDLILSRLTVVFGAFYLSLVCIPQLLLNQQFWDFFLPWRNIVLDCCRGFIGSSKTNTILCNE
ncbi:MAG: hypothetical protein CM15mP31_3990 [Gammaproteobacteria bacterium]|nr:MAG: hypothetical protein CM15mP31_3990 [Gammaproteobacteria bacterium]